MSSISAGAGGNEVIRALAMVHEALSERHVGQRESHYSVFFISKTNFLRVETKSL